MDIKVITIKDNEEFLRSISDEVDLSNKDYLEDIKKLEEYCKLHEVFAMAAIQIGIPKRIIYFKNTDLNKIGDNEWNEKKVMINPIIKKKTGCTFYWGACASCLNMTGLVKRPYKIEIEYYNEECVKKTEIYEGFESTVLSHEYDHLNGVLHFDIASKVLKMTKEERIEFRKKHPYQIISKKGKYSL